MVKRTVLNISNVKGVTEMRLYGCIGSTFRDGITAKAFSDEFSKVDIAGKAVNLRINSPGGEIYDGIAIFNQVRNSKANVSIYIDGIAASMATVIALSGKKLYMSKFARFMTHKASGGIQGDSEDMKNYAIQLDALETTIAGIYAQKTGLTIDQAKAKYLVKGVDRWISAKEALDEKIIDGIYDLKADAPPTNEIEPMNLFNYFNKHLNIKNDTNMKELLIELLGLDPNASDNDVVAAVKALVNEQETTTTKVTNMLTLAKKSGKIDAEKESLYTELAKSNPQFVIDKLFAESLKPMPLPKELNIMRMINEASARENGVNNTNELGGKPKSQWGLNEYRRFAPKELETNPRLYKQLLEKEGFFE